MAAVSIDHSEQRLNRPFSVTLETTHVTLHALTKERLNCD